MNQYFICFASNDSITLNLWTLVVSEEESQKFSEDVINEKKAEERKQYKEIKNIAFLYKHYKPSCWYFEVVVCAKRLMIGTGLLCCLFNNMTYIFCNNSLNCCALY